jgi:hypothetical protein
MTTTAPPPRSATPLPAPLRFGAQPAALLAARPRFVRLAMAFVPRSEPELAAMPDEQLVRYVAGAKRAGATDHATTGTFMLLYRHEPRMRNRVRARLPRHLAHHADTVADRVLERVTKSALTLAFRGGSVGEWVRWWTVAIDRQYVSFFRTREGKALEREAPLPSERQGEDDEAPPDRLGVDLDVDALLSRTMGAEIVQSVLDAMDNPEHVAILRRAIWDDQASKLVADEFGTTDMNVDQIKTRFKRDLRAECERRGWDEP